MGKLAHPERLDGVDARLAATIREAVLGLPFDCIVVEGMRSKEQCKVNYGKGRTVAQLRAKGIEARYAQPQLGMVTWLRNPLASKHCEGKAVDVYPLDGGKLDGGTSPAKWSRFDALYHAVMTEAAKVRLRVRYGGDWDQDGKLRETGESDSPHFEVAA